MKRKVWSILLTLCMVIAMMPAAAFAGEDGSTSSTAEVTTAEELKTALQSERVTEIQVIKDLTYTDPVQTDKKIVIKSGATLTWSVYKTTFSANPLEIEYGATFIAKAFDPGSAPTVLGTVTNNGTITTQKPGYCYWEAATTGKGTFTGTDRTYINYGCVPDEMRTDSNCRINIIKDVSGETKVSLPENMTVGDTITPTVTNLIEGVDPATVFTYKWTNGSSSERYNGNPKPTLTEAGTLNLKLSVQSPYVMRIPNGTTSSINAKGTVQKKLYDTIYVDAENGVNSNIGNTESAPVKTIGNAMDKVAENGTIILCSNYKASSAYIEKSVNIKSQGSKEYTLTLNDFNGLQIKEGANVVLESLAIKDTTISGYGNNASKSLTLKNCTGSVTVANNQYSIEQVTLDGCNLSGDIYAKDTLLMNNSQFNGKFITQDFIAEGDCTIIAKKNAPCEVEGTITTEQGKPVTIVPANLQRGEKLIQVPKDSKDSNDSIAANFKLENTQKGLYALKCREKYNGTYISISKRVDSKVGKIAVAYEPIIQGNVMDSKRSDEHEYTDENFGDNDHLFIESSTWSGYTNTANKTWSLGDKPKLTIVLSTKIPDNNDSHFDADFSANDLSIYSWTSYGEEPINYSNLAQNHNVELLSQGVSDDGRTFTFTIQYPEVTRLDQTIEMDESDRTATCGEELDAREAKAKTALSYKSSDPTIASVDSNGNITAHKAGEVTITVRAAETGLYSAAESHYKLTVSHKFSDTWSHDEDNHWNDCVCGEQGNKAPHSGGKATCTKTAECDICGTKYGEINPNNHSNLKHVEATAATQDKEGNIEYWYCEDCDKYFRDKAVKEEITKEDTITSKLPPSTDNNQKPGDSSQNGQNNQNSQNTDNGAKTGDAMPIGLLAVLMLAAAAGIAFCGRKLYKSR